MAVIARGDRFVPGKAVRKCVAPCYGGPRDKEYVVKIGICGKGGSGKSSLVALLADHIEQMGKQVLVVDSDDSNAGLHGLLGLSELPAPLMDLIGGKRAVQQKMISRMAAGEQETQLSLLLWPEIPSRDIPSEYLAGRPGRRLMMIGKIQQPLEGCACPMGAVAKELVRKLCLEPDEVALVDLEAGLEHFGRGIEEGLDLVLVVVEPSLASLQLALRVKDLCQRMGVTLAGAVLNKMPDDSVAQRLRQQLEDNQVTVLASLPNIDQVAKAGLDGAALAAADVMAVEPVASALLG